VDPIVLLQDVEAERKARGRVFELAVGSFEVGRGELVALVGPSGSGKSTLLDVLGLLLQPTQYGSFVLGGQEIPVEGLRRKDAAKYRRSIGFVLQHGALLPFLSVSENITLAAALARAQVSLDDLESLAAELGLTSILSAKPSQISGGQRQRVALARALVHRPKVILADEPTGSVDAEQALEIGSLLKDTTRTHDLGTVLVTHDLDLAKHLGARIYRIYPEILQHGVIRSTIRLE
jgi:putative ABC transport system ATP-binding protein